MSKKAVAIAFDNRVYRISPGMRLVCEIEDELGPLPLLHERLATDMFSLSELVALTQMLLQAAGRMVDYIELGDRMLQEGIAAHALAARKFIDLAIDGEK